MLKILVITLTVLSIGQVYSVRDFRKAVGHRHHRTTNGKHYNDIDYFETIKNHAYIRNKRQGRVCRVAIRRLPEPSPAFIMYNNDLKYPHGSSGNLVFADGEVIRANCGSGYLSYPNAIHRGLQNTVIECQAGILRAPNLSRNPIIFDQITCTTDLVPVETDIHLNCINGGTSQQIEIGVRNINNNGIRIITSCFDPYNYNVHYVKYSQGPENQKQQLVQRNIPFQQGQWFRQIRSVNALYNANNQIANIGSVLNNVNNYIVPNDRFLSKGHLAAKADFPLAPSQRATFTFINMAPQWNTFNAGNWNDLEQNVRRIIGNRGWNTEIYTGTWDILRLRNSANINIPIYLDTASNRIPAPLWYFKVVHDLNTNRATAFLGLNNIYVSNAEAVAMARSVCNDVCRSLPQFRWWQSNLLNFTDVQLGYSFCCDVNDFRRTVNTLPQFNVNGLLYF